VREVKEAAADSAPGRLPARTRRGAAPRRGARVDRTARSGFRASSPRSSTLNFSEPTKLLDALMQDGRIRHDGDRVLSWAISNVVGHYDARGNVYPRKESNEKKIDPAIATIIALGVSIAGEADGGGFIYTDRDLLMF
jgi:hypothetical protein